MIDGTAAGHTFKNGVCDCGVRLADIQYVTKDDIGKTDIAHSGALQYYEVDQIQALVKKMSESINNAFGWRD